MRKALYTLNLTETSFKTFRNNFIKLSFLESQSLKTFSSFILFMSKNNKTLANLGAKAPSFKRECFKCLVAAHPAPKGAGFRLQLQHKEKIKVIAITGTPGTGKTYLAKRLSKKLGFRHIELTPFIKQNKLYEKYDRKRKTYVVDTAKLAKKLTSFIKQSENSLIIDSHLSHFLAVNLVDLCIVLKCSLKKVKKRLEKRGYSRAKVQENLDSEIFETCLTEAKEKKHNIILIDEAESFDCILRKTMKEINKKIPVLKFGSRTNT